MKKPNIIYILADDLGYGDVSCLNPYSQLHTKNIDLLAAGGMIFTNAHATSALCSPSRYSLLTGRYNWRSWLKSRVLVATEDNMIEHGRKTVASLLKEQGYNTACIGKWHIGIHWTRTNDEPFYLEPPGTYDWSDPNGWHTKVDYTKPYTDGPNDAGFDYFFGLVNSLGTPPHLWLENNHAVQPPDTMIGNRNHVIFSPQAALTSMYGPGNHEFEPEKATMHLQNKVLQQIDLFAGEDKPFFIYYPCTPVHVPLLPTDEFCGKSGLGPYGDFVLQLDAMVGQILDKLEEKGLINDTVVIFASDNGCSSQVDYPSLIAKGHNPSYVFRGFKGDIYDGGHRIPYIVRWPGITPPGSQSNCLVSLADLYATLAEYFSADISDDAAEDSISSLSLLRGETKPVREDIVYSCLMGNLAIQKGPWRLDFLPGCGGASEMFNNCDYSGVPPVQLFNMSGDIGEQWNLAEQHPDIVRELTELMQKYIETGRSTPGTSQLNTGGNRWAQIKNIFEPV